MSTLMPNRVNCTHQDRQIKVSDLHCFLIFRTFAEKLLHCVFALGLFDLCHSYYIVQFGGFTCAISQVFLSDTVSIFVRALHLSERHCIDIGTLRPQLLFSFGICYSFLAGLGRKEVQGACCSSQAAHKQVYVYLCVPNIHLTTLRIE